MKRNKVLHCFGLISLFLIAIICLCHTVYFIKAEVNYKKNVLEWQNYNHSGLIYNQNDFANLSFGFGNIEKNGCGAVAIYNILQLENRNPYFPDIIKLFDIHGQNVFGVFGSRPSRVMNILRRFGFDVSICFNKSQFKDKATNSKYAIYTYYGINNFYPFGHYQLIYDYDGNEFKSLNITGSYTFEEITKIDNLVFELMILVN